MATADEFFDSEEVLRRYLEHRSRADNPNDSIEAPIFDQLAGDLSELDIVDLGCGEGRFGRQALEAGARSYLGIEASARMTELAEGSLDRPNGRVLHRRIEEWEAETESADLVTSRLALNYVEDLSRVFSESHTALRPTGRMIISLEHPIITSHQESLQSGRRTSWLVDNYFRSGARPHNWLGRQVVKYHRTIEEYLDLLEGTGLTLERLRESKPVRAHFQSESEFERRLRIPLFLFLSARKPIQGGVP